MEYIRCVIADIPQIILADIIQQLTEQHPGIEVVARFDDFEKLASFIQQQDIDMVMLGTDMDSMAQSLNEVLALSPQTVVIAIIKNGRRACACIEDVGASELLDVVNNVVAGRCEKRRKLQ
ncbi:MAG: hypothetical protein OEZ39_14660 [Gammaproteobacteria bacterium]|nr:hypothetical protein [Gammaproteobacteria bacterium]MDH5653095.1 hypothetical protein [Gammaproteobacteria bacterium]